MTAGAFERWIRTGRPMATSFGVKFNPWHDPGNGRFTTPGAGQSFNGGGGSFGGGGATARGLWGRGTSPLPTHAHVAKPALPRQTSVSTQPATTTARPSSADKPTPALPQGWRTDVINGYSFTRDDQARTREVVGSLNLKQASRSKQTQLNAGKPDRLPTDEGGIISPRASTAPATSSIISRRIATLTDLVIGHWKISGQRVFGKASECVYE